MPRMIVCVVWAWLAVASLVVAQTREEKVRGDRQKVEAEGFWIYNDLAKGFAEARASGKPLLVVLRCIPCVECVKLDDELVDKNPRVRPLLEKFVCVRVVSTNGLDLSLFQFDTDQSFAVFMLNADRVVYGRFGTRSHRTEWRDDVSIDGLANALTGALELHQAYPGNRQQLAAKTGPAPEFAAPEKYPALKDKYKSTLNYDGNVVQSCIHCHQIGDAERDFYRQRDGSIPERVLLPFPHPKALGLTLDPSQRATVLRAEPDTVAAAAGFAAGDMIETLNGQPLLSIADVQWVLQQTSSAGASLPVEVRRGDRKLTLTLTLPAGWRQRDDLAWRASSWGLRRMGAGGLLLDSLREEDRAKAGLAESAAGLRVKFVGQYGAHAAAKQAGFFVDDIIVSFAGRTDFKRDSDLLFYAASRLKPGERVPVIVLRDGKKVELSLPMQP